MSRPKQKQNLELPIGTDVAEKLREVLTMFPAARMHLSKPSEGPERLKVKIRYGEPKQLLLEVYGVPGIDDRADPVKVGRTLDIKLENHGIVVFDTLMKLAAILGTTKLDLSGDGRDYQLGTYTSDHDSELNIYCREVVWETPIVTRS